MKLKQTRQDDKHKIEKPISKTIFFVFITILCLSIFPFVNAEWQTSTSLYNGITMASGSVGSDMDIFILDNATHLWIVNITGSNQPVSTFTLNNNTWVWNSTLRNGLALSGTTSSSGFDVFTFDNINYHMIYGWNDGITKGQTWDGSTWVTNSSIISGVVADAGAGFKPIVFNISNQYHLLISSNAGLSYSYTWSGSTWVSNSTIRNGLPNNFGGGFNSMDITYFNNSILLFFGSNQGLINFYTWTGSTWVEQPIFERGTENIFTQVTSSYSTGVFIREDLNYNLDANLNGEKLGLIIQDYTSTYILSSLVYEYPSIEPISPVNNSNISSSFVIEFNETYSDYIHSLYINDIFINNYTKDYIFIDEFLLIENNTINVLTIDVLDFQNNLTLFYKYNQSIHAPSEPETPEAPQVYFINPNNQESILNNQNLNISWVGFDLNNDSLIYNLTFNGSLLLNNSVLNSYSLNVSNVTGEYNLSIIAFDGTFESSENITFYLNDTMVETINLFSWTASSTIGIGEYPTTPHGLFTLWFIVIILIIVGLYGLAYKNSGLSYLAGFGLIFISLVTWSGGFIVGAITILLGIGFLLIGTSNS